jgi:hypothetical protein
MFAVAEWAVSTGKGISDDKTKSGEALAGRIRGSRAREMIVKARTRGGREWPRNLDPTDKSLEARIYRTRRRGVPGEARGPEAIATPIVVVWIFR